MFCCSTDYSVVKGTVYMANYLAPISIGTSRNLIAAKTYRPEDIKRLFLKDIHNTDMDNLHKDILAPRVNFLLVDSEAKAAKPSIAENVKNFFAGAFEAIKGYVDDAKNAALTVKDKVVEKAKDIKTKFTTEKVAEEKGFFAKFADKFKNISFEPVKNFFTTSFANLKNLVKGNKMATAAVATAAGAGAIGAGVVAGKTINDK